MKKTTLVLLFSIFQLMLFNLHSYSQFSQVPLKLVNSSNAPLTGQAGNITFRKSPYSGGDVIGGLTVNEVGITGNYIAAGFTAYQQAKLYVSGTEQTWWVIQWTGDATTLFINTSGTLAFAANQSMGGFKLQNLGNATLSSDAVCLGFADSRYIKTDGTTPFSGDASMGNNKLTNVKPPASGTDAANKQYVDDNSGVEPNTIIVDGNLSADVTGKKYQTISSAITYISISGSPGSANIWGIYVYPNKTGYYTDNFIWPDYINIYGAGKVVIKNTLTYSLFVRTGLHVKNKTANITFVQSDQTLFFANLLLFNCAFVADSRGSDFGRLEIKSSTFRDCDIFYDYIDSYFTDDGGNRIMDCNFNTDMTALFAVSDKLYGWKFVTADAIDY